MFYNCSYTHIFYLILYYSKIIFFNILMILSFDIGIKNLSYCLLYNYQIIKWNNINIYSLCSFNMCKNNAIYYKQKYRCIDHKEKFSELLDYNYICKKIFKILNIIFYNFLNKISLVIIEEQYHNNHNMKKISNFIFSFFIFNNIYNVKFVSPYLKYKICKIIDNKYTKKNIHNYCIHYLKKYNNKNNYINYCFNNNIKKDDLSDSFLQGISYIYFKN